MSTTQISDIIRDIYGFDASESFISDVTDKIMPQIEEWQNRQHWLSWRPSQRSGNHSTHMPCSAGTTTWMPYLRFLNSQRTRENSFLHDECDRIAQFLTAPSEPPEERISQLSGTPEGPVPGNI